MGVTVIVPLIGPRVALVVVNVGKELPAPLTPNPIATLLFVQVKVVWPAGVLVEVKFSVPVVTVVPLQ